jgi:D-alanyl-lipoteichoic acid acyltransferase DltB (MBOAT superfamily)
MNALADTSVPVFRLTLPLAISFYTFQQITYLVDCYRGSIKGTGFINYCLFVSFFPQLIAGPIVRYNEFVPQLERDSNKSINYRNMSVGLYLFFIGMCKRVVLADTFGMWADLGFASATALTFTEAWMTSLAYTFQLYFDFSGYIDMAMGSAYLLNIQLPINFNSPYKAVSIQDFWRRWHITLSRFLKDYIYIPLGGNRKGEIRTYLNIAATFLIGGLWHGANWTFVVWGGMHGAAAVIHRLWKKIHIRIPRILAVVLTFNFINITWLFFRADSIRDAINIMKSMIGLNLFFGFSVFHSISRIDKGLSAMLAIIAIIVVFFLQNSNSVVQSFKPTKLRFAYLVVMVIVSLGYLNTSVPRGFLYFDF